MNYGQKRDKRIITIKKGVFQMKKLGAIFFAAALLLTGLTCSTGYAEEADPISSSVHSEMLQSTIVVNTSFNAFGIALSSTSTSTQTVQSTDGDGNVTTTTTTTVTTSSYKNGGMSADQSHTTSVTVNGDGKETSRSEYTDTYSYDSKGYLIGVSGSGTTSSTDYAKNPETGEVEVTGTRSGTITRTFEIRDGQACILSNSTKGDMFDKDGEDIGDFSSSTSFEAYAYLGGSWVHMQETSVSSTETDQYQETVTRVKSYTRDDSGLVTGISQTATGTRTVVTGVNDKTGEKSTQSYTMTGYDAADSFDSQQGWYISNETYTWTLNAQVDDPTTDPTAYDPWTLGTLQMIDGHLALVVDPDKVKGNSFYEMDPSTLTGETQTDENGNMIFMLAVQDEDTKEELMSLVGKQINLMWQYYVKSSASDSSGYGWIHLAPKSDWRVNAHMKYDKESKVEQWGGDWNRDKQYVVVD